MADKHSFKITLIFLTLQLILGEGHNTYNEGFGGRTPDFEYTMHSTTSTPPTYPIHHPRAPQEPYVQPRPHPQCEVPHRNINLNFKNMGINRVGDDFVTSSDVIGLDLDENMIEEVTSRAFRKVPRLEKLHLSNNKIPIKQLLLHGNCPTLKELYLDKNTGDNGTHHIPEKFVESFESLEKLFLRGNNIVQLDVKFKEFTPKLTHLYLSNNLINSTKFLNTLPISLTHLHVDKNFIEEFKSSFVQNLEELNLDQNNITQLCSETCGESALNLNAAQRLKKLQVSRNKIKNVEENTFRATRSLIYLDLSHNKIRRLSNNTFNLLGSLQELSLRRNRLTAIPNFYKLLQLRILDLSGNKIESVPTDAFSNLPWLRKIGLNNNEISSISAEAFNSLKSLGELDLSNNQIAFLPNNWYSSSYSLQILLLRNNSIRNLEPLHMAQVHSLKKLHLQENPLYTIQVKSIVKYYNLIPDLVIHLKDEIKDAQDVEYDNYPEDDEDDEDEDDEDDEDDNYLPSYN